MRREMHNLTLKLKNRMDRSYKNKLSNCTLQIKTLSQIFEKSMNNSSFFERKKNRSILTTSKEGRKNHKNSAITNLPSINKRNNSSCLN